MSKGRVVYVKDSKFVPDPGKVLVTTAPRDVYKDDPMHARLPVLLGD